MYYWQMDNDIFRMPPETDFFAVTAPLIPLYVLLLSWASWVIWRDLRAGRIQSIFPTLTLVAILLFYGFQAHERMFASYAAHTLWGISLLSGLLSVRASRHGFGLVALTALSAAVGVLSVLLNIRRLPPNLGEWAGELAANARSLMSPLPRDSDLVDDGLRQAVAIVRARAPVCTYTFSNEGLLYVLANTPPCSRFAYPFYIAFDRQAEVISEFEQTKPPIVLWTSSSPQATIYGRDLVARTPTLVAWVTAHYPYRKMLNDGYELRMLEPLNDGTK
jgi:hypothetical protein